MRLVILSRSRNLHSTHRLVEEATKKGLETIVLNPLRCQLFLEPGNPQVLVRNRPLEKINVVLPRIGTSITDYGLLVVRHFEAMGVRMINSADAILNSRNKFRCLQALAAKDIAFPRTSMVKSMSDIPGAGRSVGRFPLVMKLLQGAQGIGVMMAHDKASLESVMATMLAELDTDLLMQEFIRESKGSDIRALVVGGKVVAAMRRQAKRGEFRANIHRGGWGEALRLPKRYETLALRAAKAVGLEIAGVDILESDHGPKVLEVNSSPGFQELEKATGFNIAGMMIQLAMKRARS